MNDTVLSVLQFKLATLRREQARNVSERDDHLERAAALDTVIESLDIMIDDIQQVLGEEEGEGGTGVREPLLPTLIQLDGTDYVIYGDLFGKHFPNSEDT